MPRSPCRPESSGSDPELLPVLEPGAGDLLEGGARLVENAFHFDRPPIERLPLHSRAFARTEVDVEWKAFGLRRRERVGAERIGLRADDREAFHVDRLAVVLVGL